MLTFLLLAYIECLVMCVWMQPSFPFGEVFYPLLITPYVYIPHPHFPQPFNHFCTIEIFAANKHFYGTPVIICTSIVSV